MKAEGLERYKEEAQMLYYVARRQLNLEKNALKQGFENYSAPEILLLLAEEFGELAREFKTPQVNFETAIFEIGDCAAVLVGLIAWINNQKDKR